MSPRESELIVKTFCWNLLAQGQPFYCHKGGVFSVVVCECECDCSLLCIFQLRMFDLNGDGKLGLSEMARWDSSFFLCFCLDVHLKAGLNSCWRDGVLPVVLPQAFASSWKFPAEVWGKILVPLIFVHIDCNNLKGVLVTVVYSGNSVAQHYRFVYQPTLQTSTLRSCFRASGFK